MRNCCSKCGGPAEYTLNVLVSTYGISPRGQKTSQIVPFCSVCLSDLFDMSVPRTLRVLLDAVNTAYTALTDGTKSVDVTASKLDNGAVKQSREE